jgi:hypothetical protein
MGATRPNRRHARAQGQSERPCRVNLGVAAAKKITPAMEAEILRRRAAREPVKSIAADFDIAHQTVSKLAKRDAQRRAAGLERQAQAAAAHERQTPQQRTVQPARQKVRQPLLPAVFGSWDDRLAYYEQHSLESETDWLNYKDACAAARHPPNAAPATPADRSRSASRQHQSDVDRGPRATDARLKQPHHHARSRRPNPTGRHCRSLLEPRQRSRADGVGYADFLGRCRWVCVGASPRGRGGQDQASVQPCSSWPSTREGSTHWRTVPSGLPTRTRSAG